MQILQKAVSFYKKCFILPQWEGVKNRNFFLVFPPETFMYVALSIRYYRHITEHAITGFCLCRIAATSIESVNHIKKTNYTQSQQTISEMPITSKAGQLYPKMSTISKPVNYIKKYQLSPKSVIYLQSLSSISQNANHTQSLPIIFYAFLVAETRKSTNLGEFLTVRSEHSPGKWQKWLENDAPTGNRR